MSTYPVPDRPATATRREFAEAPRQESVPPGLLAVFAHPDDEALVAGGVLAQHAAEGARTAVVTATWAPGTPRATRVTFAPGTPGGLRRLTV